MTHLTVEEIIEFVSFEALSAETINLSAKVNEHIRSCPACMEKVSAFQMIYDELMKLEGMTNPRRCFYKLVDEEYLKLLHDQELCVAMLTAEDDGFVNIAR